MSEYIATAFSSHKRCLICRSNRVRLHLVKEYSIKLAYRKYNIFIKKDSRLCDDHLDSNGYIKEEEFNRIPTEMHRYDKMTKKYIEAFSKENRIDKETNLLQYWLERKNVNPVLFHLSQIVLSVILRLNI